MRRGWAVALVSLLIAGAAMAQTAPIRVTGGEHADFTRIVLQSAARIDWTIEPDTRSPLVQIDPATAPIDLSQAFARIPRDRLARIDPAAGGFRLGLACDCPVRAFTDRPGVVVIDILDPPAAPAPGPRDAAPAQGEAPVTDEADANDAPLGAAALTAIAERAGRALAQGAPVNSPEPVAPLPLRAMTGSAGALGIDPPTPPAPLAQADQQALRAALREALSDAIGTGLLTGADYLRASGDPVLPDDPSLPDGGLQAPAQLRVVLPPPSMTGASTTLESARMGTERDRATRAADPRCRNLDALDFLAEPAEHDFNNSFGALVGQLYGEFDRPDAAIRGELIRHYLRFGLGAEARLLIDNARQPLGGSDLLRGLADILEDRPSNARHALAGRHGCPGIPGLLAALAGPPPRDLSAHGDAIALSYGDLPAPLRRLFGPPLIERLLDDEAIDAARMIADTLRLTGPAGVEAPALPAALMMGARGAPRQGADSLAAQSATRDPGAMLLRLRLLREADAAADAALLDAAEALAAGARHEAKGIMLMAATIGHDTLRAAHAAGFERLDRLQRWLRGHQQDRELLEALADDLWQDAARRADDQAFLSLILAREDWRGRERTDETRTALGARLLALGLAEPASRLLDPPGDTPQRLLLARAMLARDRPDDTITLLEPLIDGAEGEDGAEGKDRAEADLLMARALRAAGAEDAAQAAFAALGARDEAARTAIARQDWQALADLAGNEATRTAAAPGTGAPAPESGSPAPAAAAAGQTEPVPSTADDEVSALPALDMLRRAAEAFGSDPAALSALAPAAARTGDGDRAAAAAPGAEQPQTATDGAAPPLGDAAGRADDDRRPGAASAERDAVLAGQPIAPIAAGSTELPPMLQRNAALIEQSTALREVIDALLQPHPPGAD